MCDYRASRSRNPLAPPGPGPSVAVGGAGAPPALAVGLCVRSQAAIRRRGAGPLGLGRQCARPRGRCGVGPRSAAAPGGPPARQLPGSGPGVLIWPPTPAPEVRSPRPLETVESAPSRVPGLGAGHRHPAQALDSLTSGGLA